MAFSIRAGTNWCHDFPKLARESGFCFNVHRRRVRVDWNRISCIDIDQVIRERDFLTVDDNVNNVVDYSLESEYDVKILDPNFVKLFRLAQLSVEYLLYCKQYLDQSVIILKDELRLKIENNVGMKKEIQVLEDTVKELNQKIREKSKIIESKLADSTGELFKCPHCTKTFIAATFVSAHIARRHGHLVDPYMPVSSPVYEQYRAETAKLHNEIKTLKERLNQTERVIRSECDRRFDYSRGDLSFRPETAEKGEYTSDKEQGEKLKEQQRKYQDEIASLKNMLSSEIRNLKQNDRNISPMYQAEIDANIISLKELVKKQENEIHTLRDQLREKLSTDLKNVQDKLQIQEQHWKVINERLEKQHNLDTENLSTQLKLSQEAAREMKELYESKVNELEMHSRSQTKMLEAQATHLKQLSRDLRESKEMSQAVAKEQKVSLQNKTSSQNIIQKYKDNLRDIEDNYSINLKYNKHEELLHEEIDSASTEESPKKSSVKRSTNSFVPKEDHSRLLSGNEDVESSEDIESVENNNNKYVSAITNSKKIQIRKKIDNSNSNGTLVENLNVAALQSTRRDKLNHESPTTISYKADNKTFRTAENRRQESRKQQKTNMSCPINIKQSSKTAVQNIRSEQTLHSNRSEADGEIHAEKLSTKCNTAERSAKESEESEGYSETQSESCTSESDSQDLSENEDAEKMIQKPQSPRNSNLRENFKELLKENPEILEELNVHLREVFDNKLRDLGVDPEWNGIPNATFKQKMETLAHHRNINSKKINGYGDIRQKILKDISHTLIEKRPQRSNSEKISPLDKIINKVKIKTANVLKHQKYSEPRTPILKSQVVTLRDKASSSTSNLEILPKKMRESDIHEIRSRKSDESLRKIESNPQPTIRPISVQNSESSGYVKSGILNRKRSGQIADRKKFVDELADSTSLEQLSQEGIGYLESKIASNVGKITLQSNGTKVTSTPNKSVVDIVEQSYSSIEIESDDVLNNQERAHSLPTSPKNNKSVLKSTTGSVGSLVKKKVLFDLEQSLENDGKLSSKDKSQSSKKLFPEYDFKNGQDDWNISNMSDDNMIPEKEKSPSVDNIVLKTSQSDNIARISKKIQEQLIIARQKPVGSIEAMFLEKSQTKGTDKDNNQYRSSTSIASSILESPTNQFVAKPFFESNTANTLPKPAPRTPRKQESDIESDIEELLQMN